MNCSFTLATFQSTENLILTLKDLVCPKNLIPEAKQLYEFMEHDMNTSIFNTFKNFIRWPQQMPSKAEQNKLCIVVFEQTLSNREPVVICRKSVTACFKTHESYQYSSFHSYHIPTLLFCDIYNNKFSPAHSEIAVLDLYKET